MCNLKFNTLTTHNSVGPKTLKTIYEIKIRQLHLLRTRRAKEKAHAQLGVGSQTKYKAEKL
jgi:hypothetical protein